MTGLDDRLADLGFHHAEFLGLGLEFTVFRAEPEDGGGPVAIRVGKRRLSSNVNDPWVDTGPLALLCQLDAAVMLALVFLSESPDPAQAEAAVSRVLQLRERLDR